MGFKRGDHDVVRAWSPGMWGPWVKQAVCVQPGRSDDRYWFPEKGTGNELWTRRAKRICGTCPVRDDCLDYVLRMDFRIGGKVRTVGVWAATTAPERRRVAKFPLSEQFAILTDQADAFIASATSMEKEAS